MLHRKRPLQSGPDTEIDLIEREFGGGVKIERPHDAHEHYAESSLGGIVEVEKEVVVREL